MKKLKLYIIIGIIFVIITGSISHFVYKWTGNNFLLGFFFPINESTWEHMKLAFFPMLFYSFYMDEKLSKDYPCITSSLLFGTLLSTFLIPVLFYTYSGILGRNYAFLDIGTFVISIILGFVAVYRLSLSCKLALYERFLRILILLVAICFFIFTYEPPTLALFVSPVFHFLP